MAKRKPIKNEPAVNSASETPDVESAFAAYIDTTHTTLGVTLIELADRLHADRALWLWHAAYHALPRFVFDLQLILSTDERLTLALSERMQLRGEFDRVASNFRSWEQFDFGYHDFVRQLRDFIEDCEGGMEEFVKLEPTIESMEVYTRPAFDLQANIVKHEDPHLAHFHLASRDPFMYLRLLGPVVFLHETPIILRDTWWFLRSFEIVKKASGINTSALFSNAQFKAEISELATVIANRIVPVKPTSIEVVWSDKHQLAEMFVKQGGEAPDPDTIADILRAKLQSHAIKPAGPADNSARLYIRDLAIEILRQERPLWKLQQVSQK